MVSLHRAWILTAHSMARASCTLRLDFVTFDLASLAPLTPLYAAVSAGDEVTMKIYHYRTCLLMRKSRRHLCEQLTFGIRAGELRHTLAQSESGARIKRLCLDTRRVALVVSYWATLVKPLIWARAQHLKQGKL